MRFVGSFDHAGSGHSPTLPHLTEAMPVIATPLAASIQPFEDEALAKVLVYPQTLRISSDSIVVVVSLQLSS